MLGVENRKIIILYVMCFYVKVRREQKTCDVKERLFSVTEKSYYIPHTESGDPARTRIIGDENSTT